MEIYSLMKMGLDATELRSKVIANNIANINTVGYERKYVDFEDTLTDKLEDAKIEVKTEKNASMREDGNNVDLENEKVNQAASTLQYNALVSLTNTKIAMTKSIISGR
ncbi:MAG: flagellar basal body protein [Terrisporobacter othiniensis]|uniref:Flagellar basal body rod protein FlgB n=2 Tax=Terrisporobacter TaxID=1505652 RepID=A0AAX2ZIF0_9FIRM|nr:MULTISPECIES: flagellar basal body protein [Terrisporobacter]MBN9647262.1 flagellar biosynthesis protein FlgB [Terrisporobacter glycolicus]MDU4860360.1 flagellar basal body protein [Terrisporobacter othiniensis]MDU6993411.1 flagellar basal body protein [Terrisporobacter othiniensis]UEL48565.1 flagellar basal body protein [Terrisporobacter hibernicus]UPA31425.1 flagellar basal body protein [Terrisporobacter glycolicus]